MAESHRRRSQALVLAGHGSHHSVDSAAPVYAHAARIRALGIFDEVVETFWKEEPSLRDALRLVESDDVYIVPLFLSEGYFTRVVLPRELVGAAPHQRVRHTAPVGTHPAMIDRVLRRALDALPAGAGRADTTLLIAAHGTERTTGSGGTAYRLRDALRTRHCFAHVECGFLDEAPRVLDVLQRVQTRDVVIVPFFVSAGWHAGTTLPDDLAAAGHGRRDDGPRVIYTPPVGTLEGVADIAVQLAIEAGAHSVPRSRQRDREPAAGTAARGRDAFIRQVDDAGPRGLTFLQVRIRRTPEYDYEMRHRSDDGIDPRLLERSTTADAALAIARGGSGSEHRPLRSAPDLRRGWLLEQLSATALWSALSWIYPAAAVSAVEHSSGKLRTESFHDVASRQTGIYAGIGALPEDALRQVVRTCCGPASCLRTPLWETSRSTRAADLLPLAAPGAMPAPCVRPCSLLLDAAAGALQHCARRNGPLLDTMPAGTGADSGRTSVAGAVQ